MHWTLSWQEPLLLIVYLLECLFHSNSIYDLWNIGVGYTMFVSCCKMKVARINNKTLCFANFKTFNLFYMLNFKCLHLNENHQVYFNIPFQNCVSLVCVSLATFIFRWCNNMNKPHSYIVNAQTMIVEYSFFVLALFLVPFVWIWFDHSDDHKGSS